MPKRLMPSFLAAAAIACAQYTPPPQSYTIVQRNSLFGPDTTTTLYRNGSKAAFDIVHPGGTHVRSVYDLQAQTNITWDASQAAAECGNSTFKGDWGDPFVGSAGIMDDLNKLHPTTVRTATVNGVSTKVADFVMEGTTGKSKVRIDPKYGMIMRILMAQPSGAPKIAFETTQITFA